MWRETKKPEALGVWAGVQGTRREGGLAGATDHDDYTTLRPAVAVRGGEGMSTTTAENPLKIILPTPTAVPAELRDRAQWVMWTYTAGGRKLPMDAKTGRPASSTDPSTWATFEQAMAYARQNNYGIGFVLTPDDPFCALDLDNCLRPDGGLPPEIYDRYVEPFASYTEVTPSGRGLRVWIRASLPGHRGLKKPGLEIYDSSRYLTVTGRWLAGTPKTIEPRQTELGRVVAEEFPGANGHTSEPIPAQVTVGTRNEVLFRLGCSLRAKGLAEPAIEAALQAVNAEHCNPPLDADEVAKIAKSACRYEAGELNPPRPSPVGPDDDTLQKDYGHATVLARLFNERYRWAVHRGSWMRYDGRVWRPVPEEAVAKDAADALRHHYATQLANAADRAAVLDLTKKIAETCTYARITGALSFLKGWDGILTLAEEWDRDPWLLNVNNGTLNLRTCTLQPHDPADLLTKLAPVDYEPQATGPNWQAHLQRFLPNANVRRQVQRDLGGALPGVVLEESLPIWWGSGGNGKTTTLMTILRILGDYGCRAAPDLLVQSKYDRHPTEIADLCGKRLAFSVEMDKAKHLAEALVKDLTGGDKKKARFMRGDFFEFAQTFSLVLVCNQKPIVTGTDWGIWRRLRLVPWEYRIPEHEKREQEAIIAELLSEGPAILSWLLAGLRDRQQDPHWLAEEVRAITEAYRAESDLLADFIAEQCELGPRFAVPKGELYIAYEAWCERNHENPVSTKTLTRLLGERGVASDRGAHGTRVYLGIRLQVTHGDSFSNKPLNEPKSAAYMENVSPSVTYAPKPGVNGTVAEEGELSVAEAIPPAEAETLLPEKAQPVAVTKHRGEPADEPIPDDATLLAEAEAASWPRVQVAPATYILPGEEGWRRALPWLGPAERRRALAGLRDLASGHAGVITPAEGEGEPRCACGAPAEWLCCGEPVCSWHMCVNPNPADGCDHPTPPPPEGGGGRW
jgi:putative DNA primase/helicase